MAPVSGAAGRGDLRPLVAAPTSDSPGTAGLASASMGRLGFLVVTAPWNLTRPGPTAGSTTLG